MSFLALNPNLKYVFFRSPLVFEFQSFKVRFGWLGYATFNPLLPCAHKSARIAKISILKLERIMKKFTMSIATKCQLTKRVNLKRIQAAKD